MSYDKILVLNQTLNVNIYENRCGSNKKEIVW